MIAIRANTAKLLKEEFKIDPSITEVMFENGFLTEQACRNVLIRDEYKRKAQSKEKQRLKGRIADKYCVSVELIEKIIKKEK